MKGRLDYKKTIFNEECTKSICIKGIYYIKLMNERLLNKSYGNYYADCPWFDNWMKA